MSLPSAYAMDWRLQMRESKGFRLLRIYPGLCRVSRTFTNLQLPPRRTGGGPRGEVVNFSRASRWRLLQSLAKCAEVYQGRRMVFCTLTFADENLPQDGEGLVLLFRAFIERLRYAVKHGLLPAGADTFFWKKEFGGKFGRIHYHLIFPLVSRIPYKTLSFIWRQGFIFLQSVAPKRVTPYIAKYVAKEQQAPAGPAGLSSSGGPAGAVPSLDNVAYLQKQFAAGRYWGVIGRRKLSFSPLKIFYIGFEPGFLSGFLRKISGGYVTCWSFTGAFLIQNLRKTLDLADFYLSGGGAEYAYEYA